MPRYGHLKNSSASSGVIIGTPNSRASEQQLQDYQNPSTLLKSLEDRGKLDETRNALEANIKTILNLSPDFAYVMRWMSNDKTVIPSPESTKGFIQALNNEPTEANLSAYLAGGMDRSMKDMFGIPFRPGNTLEQ